MCILFIKQRLHHRFDTDTEAVRAMNGARSRQARARMLAQPRAQALKLAGCCATATGAVLTWPLRGRQAGGAASQGGAVHARMHGTAPRARHPGAGRQLHGSAAHTVQHCSIARGPRTHPRAAPSPPPSGTCGRWVWGRRGAGCSGCASAAHARGGARGRACAGALTSRAAGARAGSSPCCSSTATSPRASR